MSHALPSLPVRTIRSVRQIQLQEELTRHDLFSTPWPKRIVETLRSEAEDHPDSTLKLELVVHPEPKQDAS
jgi:hypothetical protein